MDEPHGGAPRHEYVSVLWQASSLTPVQVDFLEAVEQQLQLVQEYVSKIQSSVETSKLTKLRNDLVSSLERDISNMVEQSAERVAKKAVELGEEVREADARTL